MGTIPVPRGPTTGASPTLADNVQKCYLKFWLFDPHRGSGTSRDNIDTVMMTLYLNFDSICPSLSIAGPVPNYLTIKVAVMPCSR